MANKSLNIKQRYNNYKKNSDDSLELKSKHQKYPHNIFDEENVEKSPATIIKYALKNDRASKMMEKENKLVFIVDVKATKPEIN